MNSLAVLSKRVQMFKGKWNICRRRQNLARHAVPKLAVDRGNLGLCEWHENFTHSTDKLNFDYHNIIKTINSVILLWFSFIHEQFYWSTGVYSNQLILRNCFEMCTALHCVVLKNKFNFTSAVIRSRRSSCFYCNHSRSWDDPRQRHFL